MLEENYCFDAEMYADELQLEEDIDFREDHRSKFLKGMKYIQKIDTVQ